MADKKITDLQPAASITDTLNFPSDNGIMSLRATALQIKNYILAAGNVVRSMIAADQRLPIGGVFPFAGTTAPTGYLLCDGSAISRTTYSDLFTEIGTTYGAGDGSTTFNVPDTRGIFIQGAGSQTISSKSFSGTLGGKSRDSTARPQTDFTTGIESANHSHGPNDNYFVTSYGSPGQTVNAGSASLSWNYRTNTGTQSSNHTHTVTGGGDTFTKPGSITLNHIIKY